MSATLKDSVLVTIAAAIFMQCGAPGPPPPHEVANLRAMLARPQAPKEEGLREARALAVEAEKAYKSNDRELASALGSEGSARLLQAEALGRKEALLKQKDEAERHALEDAEAARLFTERAHDAELEGAELDRRISSIRDVLAEAKEGPATPERIAARRASARALLGEARLLCGASALLGGDSRNSDLEAVESTLSKPAPKTNPEASRKSLELVHRALAVRTDCLQVLTRARSLRAKKGDSASTVTLDAATLVAHGWSQRRDERGTTMTAPSAFDPRSPSDDTRTFASAKNLQIVHKTARGAAPATSDADDAARFESALRERVGSSAKMRFETVATDNAHDSFEFTLVE